MYVVEWTRTIVVLTNFVVVDYFRSAYVHSEERLVTSPYREERLVTPPYREERLCDLFTKTSHTTTCM